MVAAWATTRQRHGTRREQSTCEGEHGDLGVLEQDEDDEADQRQGLGEGDTEEHGRAGHAGRFGLAGHGGDGVADDDADADAGANGGRPVADTGADRAETLKDLGGRTALMMRLPGPAGRARLSS